MFTPYYNETTRKAARRLLQKQLHLLKMFEELEHLDRFEILDSYYHYRDGITDMIGIEHDKALREYLEVRKLDFLALSHVLEIGKSKEYRIILKDYLEKLSEVR